ncbi:MAG: 50S ribosomal protein L11 methyltransferase [Nitrospira sp.]|nr:50S ribosomal protein L11 methyltransferase [Nitrospira sp.]
MSTNWVEVCIQEQLDAGELLSRLDDAFVQGAWEGQGLVRLYWPEDQWSEERLATLRQAISGLAPSCGEVSVSVKQIPSKDWNEAWARSVKPLRIGRLVIRPTWEPVALGLNDIEIVLDPKQAFGTGHHATTRMLLMWLQQDIRGGEQVLDVGTGSAILAMAAVKLGAASAIGVDHDSVAADCAREYVGLNGLHDRIEIIGGTLADLPQEKRTTPDLVLANLDRQTILDVSDNLAGSTLRGARIMISGILVDQRIEILDRFSNLGCVCVEQCEEEGWVAMKFLRPESCDGES